MTRKITSLILSSGAFVGLAFGLATLTSSIPMPNADLKGGSTKVGQVTPGALGTGTDLTGQYCNQLPNSQNISNLTVELENGTGTKVVLDNGANPDQEATFSNGVATFSNLTHPVTGNGCQNYTIEGARSNTTPPKTVAVWFTPSVKKTIDGTLISMNSTDLFEMDYLNNIYGSGTAKCYRAALSLPIINHDDTHDITQLDVLVSFPSQPQAVVTDVHMLDKGDYAVTGATISQSGNNVTITNFPAISEGELYYIVLEFNEALAGDIVRTTVEATFN